MSLSCSFFSKNGFILEYQDILNILNRDPIYEINNDRRKAFIEFKVWPKSLIWTSSLYTRGFYSSDS